MKRGARIIEVRRSRDGDWHGQVAPTWVAIDSEGRKFGGDHEAEARLAGERYNAGKSLLYLGSAARSELKEDV